MKTVLVWLLIAISSGSYNRGTTTVVEKFSSKEDCMDVANTLRKSPVDLYCVPAKIVVEMKYD